MDIQILDLAKYIKKLDALGNIDITPEIAEATLKVQRSAKDFAPVYPSPKVKGRIDPHHIGGTLRASIHSKVYHRGKSSVTGIISTPVEYAPHQEFGTVFQSGTPFMRPAMNTNRLGIISSLKKYLRGEMNKISSR